MVPDEGIEPPTFGLQNRCSTAELIRPLDAPLDARFGRTAISVAPAGQDRPHKALNPQQKGPASGGAQSFDAGQGGAIVTRPAVQVICVASLHRTPR